ncbi:MAG: phosphoglycerate kinase [Bacilli bacterium]
MHANLPFKSLHSVDVEGKRVLLRLDINSPIDPACKKILNTNRIVQSGPTVKWLLDNKAKVAIIAHQGDTLDYQNLISMEEHACKLSEVVGYPIAYIDDVCGPAAQERVEKLHSGEAILLGNLRYLCEEISTFEEVVPLTAQEMKDTYLVRSLAPLFDLYVNEAFSAAHRNARSMVAFQYILTSVAGPLLFKEVSALSKVMKNPTKPSVFVLGGAKISDAFGMIGNVLKDGSADTVITTGVTGEIFLLAQGYDLGVKVDYFLNERSLKKYITQAKELIEAFPNSILYPRDLAFEHNGKRVEVEIEKLPVDELFLDIGENSIKLFSEVIKKAGTIFVNGPAGKFESPIFEHGTKMLWRAISDSTGYSVVGGGDSVMAATKFCNVEDFDYVCTAGGAMVRFLSGRKLPLLEALEHAK